MPAFDLTEFFKLSSVLNYNLSAESLNRYNVLVYILAGKRLDPDDQIDRDKKSLMMEALGYLFSAYSHKRRRLGPMAVLHGLFSTYFAPPDSRVLNRQLASLYQDKPLMIQACIAFIVIFLGFLNDPRYYVRGISVAGIEAS